MTRRWRLALSGALLALGSPARGEDLLLDAASGHIVVATVNGVALRLRVALDAQGYVVLNREAAQRARLGRGDRRTTMAIGPVRLKGHAAKQPVRIGGTEQLLFLHWYESPVDQQADGVISPGLLPYDRVSLRYRPAETARESRYRVQLSTDDGLHVPVRVNGAYSIAARFSPTAPFTVATGAAAAMMAETHGGTLSSHGERAEIGFGVRRPTRWLSFAQPVRVGDIAIRRLLMRTGDFLGEHRLPASGEHDVTGDVIVTASGERQKAVYRMTLGTDVLGICSEAEYRRAERDLTLRCRWRAAAASYSRRSPG